MARKAPGAEALKPIEIQTKGTTEKQKGANPAPRNPSTSFHKPLIVFNGTTPDAGRPAIAAENPGIGPPW
jgi:hypothetical protein